jgi:hypothetical protein
VDAPFGKTPRFLRRGFILPRFVKSFDTFDMPTADHRPPTAPPPRVGSLDDDIEVWLYPDPSARASFALFDGTELREGETHTGTRRVEWRFFKSEILNSSRRLNETQYSTARTDG